MTYLTNPRAFVAFDRPATSPSKMVIAEPRDQSRVEEAMQAIDVQVRSSKA